jgi:Spy/CpxP family protein refolding chaperone
MQKQAKLVFISLGLGTLLAIAALAQTSTPETSTPGTQPQTTSPAQSSPSPQQSPAPPAETQSSGSSSARPTSPQSGNGPSIDQELQLSDDQKQKIAAVVDDENRQIESVRNDNSLSLEQKQQKALAIRQTGSPKIKAILTPEQLEKLAAIQQRMRQQQGGSASPSQAPPQR